MLTMRFELISASNGQLLLVISFGAVSLFVMSGAGLTPSNSNAATSDSKLSGRDVPMVKAFAMALC